MRHFTPSTVNRKKRPKTKAESGGLVPCAVLVLAAECQFAVFAKRKEEGVHGFRLTGGGEGGLATFALTNPDCIDATQTTRALLIFRLK